MGREMGWSEHHRIEEWTVRREKIIIIFINRKNCDPMLCRLLNQSSKLNLLIDRIVVYRRTADSSYKVSR